MELNFEGLGMQKWDIPTDRAQRTNGKYGTIYPVFMFTPQVMVIKMSKMAHFFVFSAGASKKLVTVSTKYLCAFEDLLQLFQKMLWIVGFWATMSEISTLQDTEFHYFLLTQQFFDISTLHILQTVTPKPMNHTIFWKNSKRSFRCTF